MSGQRGGSVSGSGSGAVPDDLTVGDDVTIADDLFVGDGTASPVIRMSKSDAGTDDIEMYSNGVHRCTLRLSSTENFNLIIRDAAGAAVGTLAFNTADAALVIPAAASVAGSLVASGLVNINAAITPTTLAAGSTDNYAPTGLTTASALRLTGDGGGTSVISGIVPTVTTGRVLLLMNVGTVNITLDHDAVSTAANRILCPGSVDLVIPANGSRMLWYDATSARWRVLGPVA